MALLSPIVASRRRGRRGAGVVLALVLCLWPRNEARADGTPLEMAVKATYLYKFAPFVEWPPRAFASPSSPLQLCVLGQDPFGSSLERAVSGQSIDGRAVSVRRLQRVDAAGSSHRLCICASEARAN